MQHTFHCHLSKSFRWYKNWHQHPHHQHTHWSVFSIIAFFIFSFISGSIHSTGQLYTAQNIAHAQTLTISQANFSGGSDLDVRGWQQTINLQSVTFNGIDICLNSNDYNMLTGVPDGGGSLLSGNLWIFAFINGRWEAGTYDYFRPTTNGCTQADSVNHYGYLGGAVRNSTFTSTKFVPQTGVTYGFMISGIARTGLGLDGTNEHFISNIITIPWTGPAPGSSGQFDLSQPNNTFYNLLSQYTNAAKTRGIYTLLAAYNMWLDDPGQGWSLNPFNPANNINPETDLLTSPDIFIGELGLAMSGNISTQTRQFLRNVWQTFITRLAQNTPDTVLFQPLSEPYKDAGLFDKTQFLTQANQWWGKGKLVDNPPGRNDTIHPQAVYRDYHYDFSTETGANLIGPNTIVNTDTRCDPPGDSEITSSANAAKNNGGNYLVYDCASFSNWTPRVISAINAALGGSQPSVNIGQGRLIGYGGPDFWINIVRNGSYISFLDQLKNAGANLTFALAVLNPQDPDLPWVRSSGGAPSPSISPPPPTIFPPPPPPIDPGITLSFPCQAAIRGYTGKYANDVGGWNLNMQSTTISSAETFKFIDLGGNNLALQGVSGNYANENAYNFNIQSNAIGLNETLTFISLGGYQFAIRGNSGDYARDEGGGNFYMDSATIGQAEILTLVPISGTCISSSIPGATGTESPIITSINPLTAYPGETIEIIGEFLGTTVQFTDTNGQSSYATGIISEDERIVTVIIPDGLPAGIYYVSIINPNDVATASDVLTIIEIQNIIGPSAQSLEPPTTASTFQDLISSAFNYAILLVGIAVFVMILWAGFLWLTSAANPGNIATAKGYISNAIFGGILLLSSYVILYTINPQLVGGEFDLKGIPVGPSISVPVQPPSNGGNVISNTGCGTNQQFAQDLIDDLGINKFSASAGCGGNNHAQQNILDMASGLCPSVCADKCSPACTAGGPNGDITVDPEILEALSILRTDRAIRFTVTSFTTGDHSLTSYHYAGRAVDIVPAQANSADWSEARLFLDSISPTAICEIAGKVIPKCDDFSSGAHIHWQK